MGMSDQENDSPQPPAEQQREMELTNESLVNGGENGDQQPHRPVPGRNDSQGSHRPKRRVTRRKIRVELIKEPAMDQQEDSMEEQQADIESPPNGGVPGDAPLQSAIPATGGAYAAASAPASAGTAANGGDQAKPPTQTDNRLHINDLSQMSMPDLRGLASKMGVNHEALVSMKKQEIIFQILKGHTERGGVIYAFGALEILPDGYGFLRSPNYSYLPGPDDIYISPSQIRLFNLKTGDTVAGQIRSPKEGERFFAMLRVETVNFDPPLVAQTRVPFDNLTPLYPDEMLNLETAKIGRASCRERVSVPV
jgi:transcription termination factor Rho